MNPMLLAGVLFVVFGTVEIMVARQTQAPGFFGFQGLLFVELSFLFFATALTQGTTQLVLGIVFGLGALATSIRAYVEFRKWRREMKRRQST